MHFDPPEVEVRALQAQLAVAEDALTRQSRRLQVFTEACPVGICQFGPEGSAPFRNQRWIEIWDADPMSLLTEAWLDDVHPADRMRVAASWQRSVTAGDRFSQEFRVRRPDRGHRTVLLSASPEQLGQPEQGFVCILDDLTERRLNESRMRFTETFLAQTGQLAGVGGWMVDLASGAVTWSEMTRRIHEVDEGYMPTVEQAIEFYAPESRLVIRQAVEDALHLGRSWDLELPLRSAKGRDLWVRTFGEVQMEDGHPVRLLGAFQDVTAYRAQRMQLATEQALRQQVEQHAQELDQLLEERGEMLDVMAHEVRQPLNNASAALQSAASALRDVGQGPASERLARAQAVMAQVLASIDNTLAVASTLARTEPIQCRDEDVDTLLAVSIAEFADAQRSRIQVQRTTRTRTAPLDMSLMRLALRNLLTNGLKYSLPGSPVVIEVLDSDEPLALVIDVTSTGIVIPPELLPQLFTRGARAVHPGVAAGHGLGLHIVDRVMALHGGAVELMRNDLNGVTFRLWLHLPPD